MKKVLIFGSTGSIGQNTLKVISQYKKEFQVVGLCAFSNVDLLKKQIKEFSPKYICLVDEEKVSALKDVNKKIKLFVGKSGLEEFSSITSDISLMAISGVSSLLPLLINIKHTKCVALANKEALVVAGEQVLAAARRNKTTILPVDSEINAIFQLIDASKIAPSRVYVTASGGALLNINKKISQITINDVLTHPTWNMGKKITIDCATLVNKAFEVIEAHRFFNISYDNIGIVIHKQSYVHAFVEFVDKSLSACIYPPDMKVPIAFALHYPLRKPCAQGVNFNKEFSLSFLPFEIKKYPLCDMVLQAARRNDNLPAILNACDEVAIDYFLKEKIRFYDIYKVMGYFFEKYPRHNLSDVKSIFYWDNWARIKTREYLEKLIR